MMETIQHGNSEYPFSVLEKTILALFDFHCVEWHWHVKEFEFVFVQKGDSNLLGLAKSSFH